MRDNPSIRLIQQMIRNRCINTGEPDSGNEIVSAMTLKDFFKEYGIECEIIEGRQNRSNLLVRIPGRNPEAPSLMYMGHLDVVDANPDNWSFDPFGGDIVDGFIRGRGAVDMLNMTSAMAAGIAEYYAANGRAEGDICYLAVADEEASGKWGAEWLTGKYWEKVRCDYMITELGGFFVPANSMSSGKICLTSAEKGVSRYTLTVSGKAAHGSMPFHSDNALVKIAEIAASIGADCFKLELTEQYERMVRSLIDDSSIAEKLLDPQRADSALDEISDSGLARFLHAAGRMTVSPTILRSGNKDNVIPDSGELCLDVRSLPGYGSEEIINRILSGIRKTGVDVNVSRAEFFPANSSDIDTILFKAVKTMAEKKYPDHSIAPLFISSVSDGRFWRRKGTQVYGFCMFAPEMTMENFASMIHGVDEKISVESMNSAFEFYRDLPDMFFNEYALEEKI